MNRLVIIRHGLTEWTTRFTGWTDVDLAEAGVALTKKYASKLKSEGYTFDIGYTSVLKRGIRTLEITLETLGLTNIPVVKDWHLNERHYGALQGLNKAETAKKYGDEQVLLWRRSFATPPPPLPKTDPTHPINDPKYKDIDKSLLPDSESLKNTYERVIPYFKSQIIPAISAGKKVILSGHSNSIRAIVKFLENIPDDKIPTVNIPYCIPLVYEFESGNFTRHYYLESPEVVEAAIESVKNQAKN